MSSSTEYHPSRANRSVDHADHDHDHPVVSSGNKTRVLIAAVLIIVFMVAEAVGGILTGSLALLADAAHMLTDSIALVLAYIAYRVGERPATSRMTFGFDRLQILVAYTNGLMILVIAVWIWVEAAERLSEPQHHILAGPMLIIAVFGLAVNIIVLVILNAGDKSSLNLRGAILHVVGDLLASAATIIAALIILFTGWQPADPILSILVGFLLLRAAWKLVRESGLILLEAVPADIERNIVADDLAAAVPGVTNVHHMHIWTIDGRRAMATLHARLAANAEPSQVVMAIKARLKEVHAIGHATVEIETGPQGADDEEEGLNGTS